MNDEDNQMLRSCGKFKLLYRPYNAIFGYVTYVTSVYFFSFFIEHPVNIYSSLQSF